MSEDIYFKIAEHLVQVKAPVDLNIIEYLPSFKDFLVEKPELFEELIADIEICMKEAPVSNENLKVLTDQSSVWSEGFSFQEGKDSYFTSMASGVNRTKVLMVSSKDFKTSKIYLSRFDEADPSIISWFLMIVFGQRIVFYNTVLIHASTVEHNLEEAYAFLGKSGTGKSTHSKLWLKYFDKFTLLNDDNPAIRVFDDNKVYIYGTPWSGKTKCYRNLKVELKGLIRLSQAKENRFAIKSSIDSLIMLLPSCTAIRWNKLLFNKMVDTVQAIVKTVPVGYMECLIDEEAAKISYNGIKLIN